MIQAAIQILINDSDFKTAIGLNRTGNRYKVYPVVADQDEEPPYCVVFMSSGQPSSQCTDDIEIEVVICSKPGSVGAYIEADDLANKARTALEGHAGLESNSGYTLIFNLTNMRDGFDKQALVVQRVTTYRATVER